MYFKACIFSKGNICGITLLDKLEVALLNMPDDKERRCAYLHLYGVSQACALLALKRKENAKLAIIASMLHDIYSYANMDAKDHVHKGTVMARNILDSGNMFSEDEKDLICTAIYNRSNKSVIHDSLDEILKDADVMQHVMYNPLFDIKQHEKKRFDFLKNKFNFKA